MPLPARTLSARPAPEDFGDYRQYLQAMTHYLKENQRGFSFRSFTKRAGFSSPSILHDVLEGRREIAPKAIEKFARGLGLTSRETDAFEALVLLGRAKTDAERNRQFAKLRSLGKRKSPQALLSQDQYDVYSLWYALPIRELLLHPEFKEEPVWIARRLRPRVRPTEAKEALDLLERVGLAVRDANGRLRPADPVVTTPPAFQSLAARNYHRSMLAKAAEALDELPPDERNVTSVLLSVSRSEYKDLCRKITDFQDGLLAEYGVPPPDGKSREVLASVFQVFPVTKEEEEP